MIYDKKLIIMKYLCEQGTQKERVHLISNRIGISEDDINKIINELDLNNLNENDLILEMGKNVN